MQETFQAEHLYALRRILVRRLQAASRGVPRRARFQAQEDFVREWEQCRHEGTWEALAAAIEAPQAALPPSSLLFHLAGGLGLAPERLAGERSNLAFSPSESRVRVSRPPASPRQTSAPDEGTLGLQGDLFAPELALHPL